MKAILTISLFLVFATSGFAASTPPADGTSVDTSKSRHLTEVSIVSDGVTWVSIGDVEHRNASGKWSEAPFKYNGRRMWRLPPGNYEIIGRRKGFKDVRKVIHVVYGGSEMTSVVICGTRS